MSAQAAPPRSARPRPLYPQLRARKNVSREQVAAHQRARLQGAMIEAVARHGYTATTVEELTSLAGVTKKALYRHFDGKLECFLSTYDAVISGGVERISAAYRGGPGDERDWAQALCRAFDAFVEVLAARPKPWRLALVEVLAAGPVALERIEHGEALFERMIAHSLAQAPGGVTLPPVLVKGVVHGVWYVARGRLLEAQPAAMAGCGQELLDWLLCYRCAAAGELDLAAGPPPRCLVRERRAQRIGDEPRIRMLRAAAQIAAAGGYEALTSGQIVGLADVEWDAFSQQFKGTEECFLASVELLSAQALGHALHDSEGAPSWPAAVCRALQRLLAEVAEDPVFARVAFVEIFAAGPAGVQRRSALMRSFAEVLERHAPPTRQPSPLVLEAIVGAVWGIVHHQVVHGRARALPCTT
jgi:AcrR family transcriptional regulator